MSYWNKNWSNYNNQKRLHYNKYNRFIVLVAFSIEISNIRFIPKDFELTNYLIKKLVSKDYL